MPFFCTKLSYFSFFLSRYTIQVYKYSIAQITPLCVLCAGSKKDMHESREQYENTVRKIGQAAEAAHYLPAMETKRLCSCLLPADKQSECFALRARDASIESAVLLVMVVAVDDIDNVSQASCKRSEWTRRSSCCLPAGAA